MTLEELFIQNIKNRIEILQKSCSSILCMNNVFVMYNNNIVLELKTVNPSWLNDIRPILKNQIVKFVDFKNFTILTEDKQIYTIDNLLIEDLRILNSYFEKIVPLPSSESLLHL